MQAEVGLGVRAFSRPVDPGKNRLLSALPPHEVERLLPNFQQISFALGDVVYEFSGRLDYVYFPTTAIVSLLYTLENGATAAYRFWTVRSWKRPHASVIELSKRSLIAYLNNRRAILTSDMVNA